MKLAVVAMVFLMGASAYAQGVPAAAPQDQSATPQDQAAREPYGGPSLLSRGDNPTVLRGTEAPLRPYLGVTGAYSSDNRSGYSGSGDAFPSYGGVGMYGVTGSHTWLHTEIDLDYHGSYRNFASSRQQNGFDNSLNLAVKHQLSPRLLLSVTESLSDVRNFSGLPISALYGGTGSGYNPLYNTISGSSLAATPTLASVGGVRMTYQMTARVSVSAGGSGIISRQNLPGGTIGSDGWVASGDIAYRLTRYQTISAGYSFTHFGYTGRYGSTDIHALNLSYAVRLGRDWELALTGGVSRSEILGEVLDPFLAQLLGVPAVFVKTYSVSYAPIGSALLTRSFHHATWSSNYDHLALGAGGLYGVSTYEHGGSIYTYTGLRRLDLNAGAGYYRFVPYQQPLAGYRSFGASGGFSVRVGRGFSWVGRLDWRHYVFVNSQQRDSYYATSGFAWRPGHVPVSLW